MVASVWFSRSIFDVFLGLQGLMQAVAVPAPRHEPAGEFVDDDDLRVLDHVVHIPLEEQMGLQRLVDVVHPIHVLGFEEIADGEEFFGLFDAFFGQVHRPRLFIDLEVDVPPQPGDDPIDLVVLIRGFLGGPGNDQRRARFVDQDGVDFVDDGKVESLLDTVGQIVLHVVAEIIEAEVRYWCRR